MNRNVRVTSLPVALYLKENFPGPRGFAPNDQSVINLPDTNPNPILLATSVSYRNGQPRAQHLDWMQTILNGLALRKFVGA